MNYIKQINIIYNIFDMINIFSLYCDTKLIKRFAHLNHVVRHLSDIDQTMNFEIYVEEYNDDIDMKTTKTLLYKNNTFQIENIFDYY